MSNPTATRRRVTELPAPIAAVVAIIGAAVVSTAVNSAVAALAHGAGAPHGFRPLEFATYTGLTVVGVIAATVGWLVVRSRSRQAARTLRVLVPAVLLLSFIPDIAVGVSKSQPHTTWGGVIALMIMHLVVAVAVVLALRTMLPVAAEHD